ncbi:ATP-grasp domain-containing protein [Halpernia frigidisoli]|uniref:Glutathione synthetase, ATP-grasp domain n=1 Tax=Halpernia frigidisoli TaxID=1125876 RepID=A0A1I3GJT9_9FLAO|nr:hypothetical protein [Halpernia frigidisoli]SFI23778.1 glutathione synthetase, ATP-grasp domain [Halpernia frigidisoli]
MKIAFLTSNKYPEILEKEKILASQLPEKFKVKIEIWNDPKVDWASYDCLVFRTIWDYFEYPKEFDTWLNLIEKLGVKTLNPLSIIKYNQHKFYLKDLEKQDIAIIPTVFIPKNTRFDLGFIKDKQWGKAVIKPAVSGGSYLTRLFSEDEISDVEAEYRCLAQETDFLMQPFMSEIEENGEISLLYFNGKYVYSVIKTPKKGDFRVQSLFGGHYEEYKPNEDLIKTGEKIIQKFNSDLLYARVDGIIKNGQFLLMEVELIEPDLYFDFVAEAKNLYLKALETKLNSL